MIRDLFDMLVPILLLMSGILATTVFVFLKSEVSALVKFFLVPLAFAASVAVPAAFITMMGYSVALQPPKEFIVLAHKTLVIANKKKSIEVWARGKGATRLYVLPYSKKLEEQLDTAAKGRQNGFEAQFEADEGSGIDHDSSGFRLRLLTPQDLSPKTPHPETQEPTKVEPPPPKYTT